MNLNEIDDKLLLFKALKKRKKPEIIRKIIEEGANIQEIDHMFLTPFQYIINYDDPEMKLNIFQIFIDNGLDINKEFLIASSTCNIDVVKFLLEKDVNVDTTVTEDTQKFFRYSEIGDSALMLVARSYDDLRESSINICLYLLSDTHIDINIKNITGKRFFDIKPRYDTNGELQKTIELGIIIRELKLEEVYINSIGKYLYMSEEKLLEENNILDIVYGYLFKK